MTVKITKPSINVREKLSELDKETGIKGEELLRADTSAEAREALQLDEQLFTDFESTGIDDNATSTAVTIDSSGNVGIGTSSPIQFSSVQAGLTLSGISGSFPTRAGALSFVSQDTTSTECHIHARDAYMAFETGTSATSAERMRITSSGNVGIGTSSPLSRFVVSNGSDENIEFIGGSATYNGGVLQYIHRDTESTRPDMNYFLASGGGGSHKFYTSSAERMRIDASGTLIHKAAAVFNEDGGNNDFRVESDTNTHAIFVDAGNNSVSFGTSADASTILAATSGGGVSFDGDSFSVMARQGTSLGSAVLYLNQTGVEGDILGFRLDGASVGTIGVDNTNNLFIQGDSTLTGLQFGTNVIIPHQAHTVVDGLISLGQAGERFKNLYLSGGVYLGGTGAANLLDDYEEGTWTPILQNVTVTYSVQSGTYTKVGNLVTCSGTITAAYIDNTDASSFAISGMPFSVQTNSFSSGTLNVPYNTTTRLLNTTARNVTGLSVDGATAYASDASEQNYERYSDICNASGTVYFTFTYRTA